jgi:two-component system, response regulator PdtaR
MKEDHRILIVEDEIISAILYKRILKRLGYRVCGPATTGEEAIEFVDQEDPDLVLMDINLIGAMDGIEVAEVLSKKTDPKIIFITGYSDAETRERALKLDPVAYILKPLDFSNLDSLIGSTLER